MKTLEARSSVRTRAFFGGAMLLCVSVALLFFFDPSTAGFFPVCTFHALTGLDCPGCGGLRAVHQLSHGNIAAAWRLNPFVVGLVPVAVWLGLREGVLAFTGRQWPGLVTRPIFGWALAGALVVFGVVRNLPPHAVR